MIRTTILATTIAALSLGCGKKDEKKAEPSTAEQVETAPAAKPAEPEKPAAAPAKDIVDVAVENGSFKTLVAALQAAGMVDALKADGPITVFAPNDEAFAKLGKETIDAVLADKEKLQAILKNHVVAGKVMAADVGGLEEATTLGGGTLAIDTSDGVKIGAATVIATDIPAKNGVIHVIDTVLIPE